MLTENLIDYLKYETVLMALGRINSETGDKYICEYETYSESAEISYKSLTDKQIKMLENRKIDHGIAIMIEDNINLIIEVTKHGC